MREDLTVMDCTSTAPKHTSAELCQEITQLRARADGLERRVEGIPAC